MYSTRFEGPTNKNELRQQMDAYIGFIRATADAIRDAKQIPSGTLYAMVMGAMDLQTYNNVLGILKRTKLVTERGYLLTWTGPEVE